MHQAAPIPMPAPEDAESFEADERTTLNTDSKPKYGAGKEGTSPSTDAS